MHVLGALTTATSLIGGPAALLPACVEQQASITPINACVPLALLCAALADWAGTQDDAASLLAALPGVRCAGSDLAEHTAFCRAACS